MLKTIVILPDGTELSSGMAGQHAIKNCHLTQCVNGAKELTLGSVCGGTIPVTVEVSRPRPPALRPVAWDAPTSLEAEGQVKDGTCRACSRKRSIFLVRKVRPLKDEIPAMGDSMFPLFPSHAPHLQAAAGPSGDRVQLQVG